MKKRKKLLFFLTIASCFALASCGKDGKDGNTPYIGDNGNWFIGEEDTGISATGPKGDKGLDGKPGSSTTIISINKTGTSNNVDTYTITFSDNKTTTFTVTNGSDGNDGKDFTIKKVEKTGTTGLIDTYTITFSNDTTTSFTITNGKDGEIVTIDNIAKTQTIDLVDTYTVTYTDGNSFSFTVTNGKDGEPGLTPHIGENGNWWIGDEDTNVPASLSYDERELTPESTGFIYTTMTVNGKSGLVITSLDESAKTLWQNKKNKGEEVNIIIPDYVASVPVIGIGEGIFDNAYITSVSLSKNTVYLGDEAFDTEYLRRFDFNNCKLETIPNGCFASCTFLNNVVLPDTVKTIGNNAFETCQFTKINIDNVTYFGDYAFKNYETRYMILNKNVEYVGKDAFKNCHFIYLEHEEKPSNWANYIGGEFMRNLTSDIPTNVRTNDEYVYGIVDNKVTLYQYLGSEKKLTIPATLDNLPINALGVGFNTYYFNYDSYSGYDEIEIARMLDNNDGYIDEIVVGNNVKRVDRGALLNGNMFIYIGENVREIYMDKYYDLAIGGFYQIGICSLVVIENKDETHIRNQEGLITYDDLLDKDDEMEFRVKANIDYDDIYLDTVNGIYYARESLTSYKTLATKNYIANNVVVLDSIDMIPVKTIDRYSLVYMEVNKITVGSNVTKIRKYGIYVDGDDQALVFIPNNVEIINADGIYIDGGTIFVEYPSKPEDWDTEWNGYGGEVIYSTSKEDFDSIVITDMFVGKIKKDNTIELEKYTGRYQNMMTLEIPRTIDGRIVSTIDADFFDFSYISNRSISIYIPSSVQIVEEAAFNVNTNSTGYVRVYLESSSVPSTFETNWVHNTNSAGMSVIDIYPNQNIGY